MEFFWVKNFDLSPVEFFHQLAQLLSRVFKQVFFRCGVKMVRSKLIEEREPFPLLVQKARFDYALDPEGMLAA